MLKIFDGVDRLHVMNASEILKQKEIVISSRQQYWVRMPDGNEWPYKALVRESVYEATKIWLGDEFQSNETNRAEFERLYDLEIIDYKKLPSVDYLGERLKSNFNNIWRCADSAKWYILKSTNILTFDWFDSGVNYLGVRKEEIGKGKMSIYPWVNDLRIGDLIFVMSKNHYFGTAIARSEYNWKGPFLDIGGESKKPAIEVEYLHKLDNPILHELKPHNRPTTFANIEHYSFGLYNTLIFLKDRLPGVYESLNVVIQEVEYPSKMPNEAFEYTGHSNPPASINSFISDSPSFKANEADYEKEHRRNKEKGDFGERYFESLIEKNPDLIELGSPVANIEKQKDGEGYDYVVNTKDGNLYYIEIKSTTSSASTPFYMSHNERAFMKQKSENYRLIRFYDLKQKRRNGSFFILNGNELKSGSFDFKPTNYEISLKSK